MTPRSELIFDHEIDISDDPNAHEVANRVGAQIRGFEEDGTQLWQAEVEWVGQGDAIAIVTFARDYAHGHETKPILVLQRIHLIWA